MLKYTPPLLRDRPRHHQVLAAGLAPAALGALEGFLIGVSPAAYWIVALLAAAGAYLAGCEHRDGWGGADRGFFGGLIYGVVLLVVHGLLGTHAKVSLGSFAPLLVVITTVLGTALGAAGGRVAREQRGDPPRYDSILRG